MKPLRADLFSDDPDRRWVRVVNRVLLGKRCERCRLYPATCRCHLPVLVVRNGPR